MVAAGVPSWRARRRFVASAASTTEAEECSGVEPLLGMRRPHSTTPPAVAAAATSGREEEISAKHILEKEK